MKAASVWTASAFFIIFGLPWLFGRALGLIESAVSNLRDTVEGVLTFCVCLFIGACGAAVLACILGVVIRVAVWWWCMLRLVQ